VVKPFTPTIDPCSTAGNIMPEFEGLLGCFPIWALVDLGYCSEFA
jgi:hypothetical protein